MPVTNAAHQTYLRALSAGLGEQSFLATWKPWKPPPPTKVPELQIGESRKAL